MKRGRGAGVLLVFSALAACASEPATVHVGSKKFTESVVLGELGAQLLERAGFEVRHRAELGGTRVLWNALRGGEIDVYPEYTGTLKQELLSQELDADASLEAFRDALRVHGVGMSRPFGFDNTYALGMREARAAELGIESISELERHPELRLGFSNEFLDRGDGWPGLRRAYRLPHAAVRGLDHDLAYRGLANGKLDVIDLYATDAEIRYYDLRVLRDDRDYFPDYEAVWLWRLALERERPEAVAALRRLEGRVEEADVIAMNARAKLERETAAAVATGFLERELGLEFGPSDETSRTRFLRHTVDHLFLVGVSLGAAIALAVPLGIVAARRTRLGRWILAATGVIQTIPSLALLVFMIPLLGIGAPPAIAALFLYSLLPIVRNTHAGLNGLPQPLRESAQALGLPARTRLRRVELPLAASTILAGVKTSAVINVGTATLGALIGAGGYGQPILTGIRLDDVRLILEGAVPAAILALAVQGGFDRLERWVVPRGLRLREE